MPQSNLKKRLSTRIGDTMNSPPKQRSHTVSRHSSPIDERPFQSRSKLESQTSLVSQYGDVAIQDVAEALHHLKAQEEQPAPQPAKLSDAA